MIRGSVIGYQDDNYTRPIKPACAFLMVHVKSEKGSEIYYLAPEKELGNLKKYKVMGIEKLQERHPDIYDAVVEHLEEFKPVQIDDENSLSRFEFRNVPLGWWCYIAAAYVEDEVHMNTDVMGNNGLGRNEVIHGEEIMKQDGNTIDNIVVPVEDKWIGKVKAPKIKVDESDEGMDDPEHLKEFRGGII
jgi:hypothetical protein